MLDQLHNLLTGAGFVLLPNPLEPSPRAILGRDNAYGMSGKGAAWTNFTNDAAGGIFEVSFNPAGLAHFLDRVERLVNQLASSEVSHDPA